MVPGGESDFSCEERFLKRSRGSQAMRVGVPLLYLLRQARAFLFKSLSQKVGLWFFRTNGINKWNGFWVLGAFPAHSLLRRRPSPSLAHGRCRVPTWDP